MIHVNGSWRVRVILREGGWPQRFIINGSDASDGIYSENVGFEISVSGASWSIKIQAHDGDNWTDSSMRQLPETLEGISIERVIESDDTYNDGNYTDLILKIREKLDPIFKIVQRPYAITPASLMMNPDGVFMAGGGIQYMAVRVKNTWTRDMPSDQLLKISNLGKQQLTAVGIQVNDNWSTQELNALDQRVITGSPVIGPLRKGETRTVYFKLDCTNARVSQPQIQFYAYRPVSEPDPTDPARYNTHKIFITRVYYDLENDEVVAKAPEGALRLKLKKITLDPKTYNEAAKCIRKRAGSAANRRKRREAILRIIRDLRQGLCDPYLIQKLLSIYCECLGWNGLYPDCKNGRDGRKDGRGGINPCPFPWLPLEFSYVVEAPFDGKYGPLPFQDPWWKILALIIAILLLIAAALVDIFDEAHEKDEIVIGTVGRYSRDNVDCALVELNNRRSFDLGVLDAQTGEPHQNARIAVGAVVPIVRQVATAFPDMRVYKSGARTGLTHGIITSINAATNQCRGEWEDGTCHEDPDRPNLVMHNQIRIVKNTVDFPGEPTTNKGDSGSIWLSDEPDTRDQVVALTHSGSDSSDANPIADVLAALKIRLTPEEGGGP